MNGTFNGIQGGRSGIAHETALVYYEETGHSEGRLNASVKRTLWHVPRISERANKTYCVKKFFKVSKF